MLHWAIKNVHELHENGWSNTIMNFFWGYMKKIKYIFISQNIQKCDMLKPRSAHCLHSINQILI